MFKDAEDGSANEALRAGLYDLPTPEVSPDFDSRIQAALVQNPSWGQTLWMALRPALPAMGWTMAAMLLLLHFAQQPFVETGTQMSQASAHANGPKLLYHPPYTTRDKHPEDDLESIDSMYASLSFFSRPMRRTTDKNG